MTYTAFSSRGPRIARAISQDLFHWERLGLSTFPPYHGVDSSEIDDKDACVFPVAIPNPAGEPELALLHRPLFPGTRPEETACDAATREVDLDREKYLDFLPRRFPLEPRGQITSASFLVTGWRTPVSPWERLKIAAAGLRPC